MTNLCYGLTKCLYIHSTNASESKVETVLWAEKQFRTVHAWRHRRPSPDSLGRGWCSPCSAVFQGRLSKQPYCFPPTDCRTHFSPWLHSRYTGGLPPRASELEIPGKGLEIVGCDMRPRPSANGVHVGFKMQWYFLNPRLYNLWEKGLWCSL